MKHTVHILVLLAFLFAVCKSVSGEEYSVRFFDDSDGLSHWHISQILQDSTGMIWVATWNGLNRFDGHHFVTFKPEFDDATYVPNDRIRRFRLRNDNNLECLIEERVLLFDTHICRFDTLSPEIESTAYAQLKQRFNPDFDRPSVARYKHYGTVELQNIWEEYVDRQGNVWLYDDHGIYIVTPRPSRGNTVNTKDVRSMHRMHNGDIWTSVRDTKEVMVYDSALHLCGYLNHQGRIQKTPVSFGEMVYCMHETEEGHILLGCKPGCVLELNPALSEIKTYPELRNAYDIQSDKNGRLWVATFGFGLWREDAQRRHFSLVPGTEGMKIRRLLFLEDGMLLAATTGGVLVVDGDRMTLHQRKLHQSHSLSSNAIMCLCMFKGNLYAGTEGGGLNRLINDLDDENWEWEHWTTENGLENDIVFELQPWSEEMLLVQGSSSLSLFNNLNETFVNFGRSFFFGDADSQLVFGEVPPLALNDSQMLVAPSRGLYALDKQKLQPEQTPIRIALSSIKRNGKDYFAVDDINHIVLTPNERNLVLRFAVLDYRNNRKLYSWRLFQENKKNAIWRTPTNVNEVIMQDIQPGEYIFEIRSTNAYGHWQNNIRRIYITVQPTFMESTIGQTFLGGLVLLIVLTITIAFLQVRFSRKKRAETLSAYLELQERLSKLDAHSSPPVAPIPEILAPGYTSENERFLNTLHQFMEENIGNSEMSIDDIALAVNMSRPTLNRRMHDLFNLSAKDFVQAARIKHACQLLRSTDLTTKEVAYACGFNDPNYFSKCFKTNTGLTPTEYREQK